MPTTLAANNRMVGDLHDIPNLNPNYLLRKSRDQFRASRSEENINNPTRTLLLFQYYSPCNVVHLVISELLLVIQIMMGKICWYSCMYLVGEMPI